MGLNGVRQLLATAGPPPTSSNHPAEALVRRMPPPGRATVLRHCRCTDCQRFSRDGKRYHCEAGIGGTKVRWSDGRAECDPAPNAWHYCAEYLGPTAGRHLFVWRYDDTPAPGAAQTRDVGPLAQTAGEAANDTTAAKGTRRGPTWREGQCQSSEDRADG